jgi:hypothetical protein
MGVKGVLVSLCHIDKHTMLEDSNPSFCPLTTLTTDNFGAFAYEIRVSDSKWDNLIEYFTVSAAYDQIMSDGTVITHTFEPVNMQSLSHVVGVLLLNIQDTTTTTIYGSTVFDNVSPFNCPLPGVPIELIRDNNEILRTVSAPDGTFDFTVTLGEAVTVHIPLYNGFEWRADKPVLIKNSYAPVAAARRLLDVLDLSEDIYSVSRALLEPDSSAALVPDPLSKMEPRSEHLEALCSGGYFAYSGFCFPCSPGYYCPQDDHAYGCPAGAYCPGLTAKPIACPSQTLSTANAVMCLVCPAGGYCQPSSVLTCPSGSTLNSNQQCVASTCVAGYFLPSSTDASCLQNCDVYYSDFYFEPSTYR